MSDLYRLQYGGSIWDDGAARNQVVEIWSNTLHLVGPLTQTLAATTDDISAKVLTWFKSAAAGISNYASLEFVKLNNVDATDGRQITDPTNVKYFVAANRGGITTARLPITTAYRVSLDDGTRNRRARGGFFVPAAAGVIQYNWRFSDQFCNDAADAASQLVSGLRVNGLKPVIFSRTEQGSFPIHRLRVGNVPDNMRSRKNAMVEAYKERPIA